MSSGALSLVLWVWSSLAAPADPIRVWVVPHLVLPAADAWQGKLVAVRVVNERLSAERLEIVISSDRPLASFSVPPLTDWRIEGEIAGFWVRPSGAGQETKGKGGADMRMKSQVVERGPARFDDENFPFPQPKVRHGASQRGDFLAMVAAVAMVDVS